MADGTTIDSLEIEIEASSSKAVQNVNLLTEALKRLQATTRSNFGNVAGQIESIGKNYPSIRESKSRSSKSGQEQTTLADMQRQYNELEKYIDEIGEKYEQQAQLAAASKELHGSASQEEIQSLQQLKQELDDSIAKFHELYKAMQEAKAAERGNGTQEAANSTRILADEYINAASQSDILRRKAEALKEAVQGALDKGDTGQADKLTTQYKRVVDQLEKLNSEAEQTVSVVDRLKGAFSRAISPIAKFKSTIGRIAFYRAIRSAIRMVTDGFKTGMENLYEYSRIAGTEFKPAMDAIATSSLYLKNSLGALVSPIVQSLAPAVEFLTDKFVDLLNVISRTFAYLQGKNVYTVAKKHATEYKDATDKAAKATKNFLLGIDELNIMTDPSSSSGKKTKDYGDMFEKAEVGSSDFLVTLKDVLFKWDDFTPELVAEKVLAAIFGIGGGIIGWSLGGPLGAIIGATIGASFGVLVGSDTFNGDGKISANEIKKLLMLAVFGASGAIIGWKLGGLQGAAIGFTLGASMEFLLNKLDFFNNGVGSIAKTALETAVLTAAGAIGLTKAGFKIGTGLTASLAFALSFAIAKIEMEKIASGEWKVGGVQQFLSSLASVAASALGGFIIGSAFGPVGSVIGTIGGIAIGLALNVAFINMAQNKAYENSEFHKQIQESIAEAEKSIKVTKQVIVNVETRYNNLEEIKTDFVAMRKVLDDMFILSDKPVKTVAEIEQLKSYVEIVNSWNLDGITVGFDELTGEVTGTRDAIYEVIDALEKQALKTAAMDMMVEAYKDVITATKEQDDALSKLNEAQDTLNNAIAEQQRIAAEAKEKGILVSYYDGTNARLAEANKKLDDATKETEKWTDATLTAKTAVNEATGQVDYLKNYLSDVGTNGSSSLDDVTNSARTLSDTVINETTESVNGLKDAFINAGWANIGKNIAEGIASGISGATSSATNAMKNLIGSAKTAAEKAADIRSPSHLFRDKIGVFIGEGIAVGIDKSAYAVDDAIENLINTASIANNGLKNAVSYGSVLADGFNSNFQKNAAKMANQIASERESSGINYSDVSEQIEDNSNNVVNAVYAMANQIVNAINSKDGGIYLDGKQLARSMHGYNAQAERNKGSSFVRVGV